MSDWVVIYSVWLFILTKQDHVSLNIRPDASLCVDTTPCSANLWIWSAFSFSGTYNQALYSTLKEEGKPNIPQVVICTYFPFSPPWATVHTAGWDILWNTLRTLLPFFQPDMNSSPPVSHHPLQASKLSRQPGPRFSLPRHGRTRSGLGGLRCPSHKLQWTLPPQMLSKC